MTRSKMMRPAWRQYGSAVLLCVALATTAPHARAKAQRTFASPEAAAAAVVTDLKLGKLHDLRTIFGPRVSRLLNSGDPVADRNARGRFVAAYEEGHRFDTTPEGTVLVIGKQNWPFAIPLRRIGGRWRFETAAGVQELIDRRIGRNELATIETMLAYVDAQHDYADWMEHRTGTPQYARYVRSHPGKQDGLYWPVAKGRPQSPLGPLFARAQEEGYGKGAAKRGRIPYHGYLFKILTAQGPDAPGGKVDYVVGGKMIGGFALVAWPARWGQSGVMTFIVNYDATVYQKNLGPKTAAIAEAMTRYDPGAGWEKVALDP